MSEGMSSSHWYTQDSPQFGLIPGGQGKQGPDWILH